MMNNMNGRKRPLFDEELSEQMHSARPAVSGQGARRQGPTRKHSAAAHSAGRDAGGGISVISALLTGRRSRSAACVIVAAVISLSAVVSVAASLVASHTSSVADDAVGQVLKANENDQEAVPENAPAGVQGGSGEGADGNAALPGDSETKPDDTNFAEDTNDSGEEAQTDAPAQTDEDSDADTADSDDDTSKAEDNAPAMQKHTVKINFWDKDSVVVETVAATLGDVLTTSGIELTAAQLANLDLTAPIGTDVTVNADVVTYDTEDVEETIPYETEYRQSAALAAGVTEVTQQGVEGNQTRQYTVTYVNGVEVSRVQTASWVDSYVQNQVITTGTGQSVSAAPSQPAPSQSNGDASAGAGTVVGANGVTYSYSSMLDVQATCYYAGGVTAYGIPADENVIGVDPSVIPFGTRVYVVGPYGDFGVRIAADCGNMYGNRIDICLNRDNPLAAGFGWQNMRVYILD